jgi:hypothetical protein
LCLLVATATLTRGAIIAFTVALVAAIVFRRRPATRRIRLIRVLAPLAGALLVAVAALVVVGTRGSNSVVGQISEQGSIKISGLVEASGSVRQRANEDLVALDDLHRSPILGLGSGSFGERHIDVTLDPPGPAYLGNLYVRTVYDTGALGLLLLLWPRRRLRQSRADLAPVAWALIFGSGTLAIAYAVTDGSLLVWPWFLLGLVRAATSLTLVEHRALASSLRPARLATASPASIP